jgi:hypothetical protein
MDEEKFDFENLKIYQKALEKVPQQCFLITPPLFLELNFLQL